MPPYKENKAMYAEKELFSYCTSDVAFLKLWQIIICHVQPSFQVEWNKLKQIN